jgi:hypothetical protein
MTAATLDLTSSLLETATSIAPGPAELRERRMKIA